MTWETKFVGRNEELSQLINNLEQARAGKGRILFITGEAGIGKTRLVKELSEQSEILDFEFLRGECIYYEGTDPYLPFIDMFKGYLSEHPYLAKAIQASFNTPANVIFDGFSIVQDRYAPSAEDSSNPDASEITPAEPEGIGLDHDLDRPKGPYGPQPGLDVGAIPQSAIKPPEITGQTLIEGKHRMFETVLKIVINISKRRPLILFLDDIQWADTATLHLLHYLCRNLQEQPILILGAYRSEDIDVLRGRANPFHELITRLGSENLLNTFELTRLDYQDTTLIVSSLLGVSNIPINFSELIYNETEGNPFFIKELLRSLIDEGALSIFDGKLVFNISPEEIIIPVSIKELINLRIHRLDEDWVDVLESASVIGYEFNFELLKNIIDLPESRLIKILEKLTEAKFIVEVSKENSFTWHFTHNKTHEVIYKGVNDANKKLIHLRLAKYLEDVKVDNIDEVVYDLAHHFYHGVDFDRALSYSIEGGEKAMRSFANKKALDLYNIALNSIRRLDENLANTTHYKEKKIEVLSHLGALNKTVGEWDKALDYYEQILPICDEIDDPQRKANIYLEIGWIFQQRSYWTEAENHFNKCLELAKKNDDDYMASEAYHGLGAVFEREGESEKAIEFYSLSRQFAELNKNLHSIAKAHNAFGRIYNQQGNYPNAVKHKEQSIYIFQKLKDISGLAKAYTSLGLTYFNMGELDKNIKYNEKCIELADKISDIRIKGYGLSNSVDALIKSDQLDKALNYNSEALEIFRKLEENYMIALNYVNFGVIFKQKQDWENSIFYFKIAIEFMENLKTPFHLAECYQYFGEMYKSKGEEAKATFYLKKAEGIKRSISVTEFNSESYNMLQDW